MKTAIFILSFLFSLFGYSQAPLADELVQIHNATEAEMNAISNPTEGSLIYNTTKKRAYQYTGTTWRKLIVEKEIVKQLNSNYTLTPADDGCALKFNSATNITLTVPSGLPIGYNISIYQAGNGKITVTESGTTIKNRLSRFTTAGLDAAVGLLCTSANTFHLSGDLKR